LGMELSVGNAARSSTIEAIILHGPHPCYAAFPVEPAASGNCCGFGRRSRKAARHDTGRERQTLTPPTTITPWLRRVWRHE
jgi:hypothetical protein